MGLSLPAALLSALFFGAIFYGLYLATFLQTLGVLLFTRGPAPGKPIRWRFLVVTCVMLVISTSNLALLFKQNVDGFLGTAESTLGDVSNNWISPTRAALLILHILLADGMLIYRCYLMYNRSWTIIALPCLLWTSTMVCGIAFPATEAGYHGNSTLVALRIRVWTDSGSVATLLTNLLTTTLLAWRLYKISRVTTVFISHSNIKTSGGESFRYAMRVLIETGVFYTMASVMLVTATCSGSFLVYPFSELSLQVIGISFNMILIRVSTHTVFESEHRVDSSSIDEPPIRFRPQSASSSMFGSSVLNSSIAVVESKGPDVVDTRSSTVVPT